MFFIYFLQMRGNSTAIDNNISSISSIFQRLLLTIQKWPVLCGMISALKVCEGWWMAMVYGNVIG